MMNHGRLWFSSCEKISFMKVQTFLLIQGRSVMEKSEHPTEYRTINSNEYNKVTLFSWFSVLFIWRWLLHAWKNVWSTWSHLFFCNTSIVFLYQHESVTEQCDYCPASVYCYEVMSSRMIKLSFNVDDKCANTKNFVHEISLEYFTHISLQLSWLDLLTPVICMVQFNLYFDLTLSTSTTWTVFHNKAEIFARNINQTLFFTCSYRFVGYASITLVLKAVNAFCNIVDYVSKIWPT